GRPAVGCPASTPPPLTPPQAREDKKRPTTSVRWTRSWRTPIRWPCTCWRTPTRHDVGGANVFRSRHSKQPHGVRTVHGNDRTRSKAEAVTAARPTFRAPQQRPATWTWSGGAPGREQRETCTAEGRGGDCRPPDFSGVL